MKLLKKYVLYLIRWQLSTPIIALVISLLSNANTIVATIVANLIGGLLFFWIDKLIFKKKYELPLWEIKEDVKCSDCNKKCIGYRIVEWGNYDKSDDENPKYRCKECSIKKMKTIKNKRDYKKRQKY